MAGLVMLGCRPVSDERSLEFVGVALGLSQRQLCRHREASAFIVVAVARCKFVDRGTIQVAHTTPQSSVKGEEVACILKCSIMQGALVICNSELQYNT